VVQPPRSTGNTVLRHADRAGEPFAEIGIGFEE
jgi:hypothetical protein